MAVSGVNGGIGATLLLDNVASGQRALGMLLIFLASNATSHQVHMVLPLQGSTATSY